MHTIPAVLGIDLGTTSVKAAFIGLDGQLLGIGRSGYATQSPAIGIAEQDPVDWWAATVHAVQESLAACGGPEGEQGEQRRRPRHGEPPSR